MTIAEAIETAFNHYQERRFDQAESLCRQVLAQQPDQPDALNLLALVLATTGQWQSAYHQFQKAAAVQPNEASHFNNMGSALCNLHRVAEGIDCYRWALELRPDWIEPMTNLATGLRDLDQWDASMSLITRALQLDPNYYEAHHVLGNLYKDSGQIERAIAEYNRALALNPAMRSIDTNRIYLLHYHPAMDAPTILNESRQWEKRHCPSPSLLATRDSQLATSSPLRIGYISPNFSRHCFGRNMLPLYREHNRQKFLPFFYNDLPSPDEFTPRIKQFAHAWRDTSTLSDDRLAQLIRDDQIDILVDHTMHMAHDRLTVFAQRPAPIQVTFGAYPAGTGMATMDYRLTDPYLDPPESDSHYTERTIRLPHSFWCYDAEGMELANTPEPGPPPAIAAGHITFGCLNNFCKVNSTILNLWSRVLDAVPRSRLLLMTPPGEFRRDVSAMLGDRVDFVPRQPRRSYFELYRRIDICLDTWPYNGHTTSLDSFWMGVPVITLVGARAVGRAGLSQLSNLGLQQLAAPTDRDFISIAASLAADLARLADLRKNLRQRMLASPLTDAPAFARGIESAYRLMWRELTEKS